MYTVVSLYTDLVLANESLTLKEKWMATSLQSRGVQVG